MSEPGARALQLLKTLVGSYIRDGQPMGSKSLLQESGLQVSAATVRNIMSDLEERGLVSSPHTSAGKVPTSLGYRLFVDQLLTVSPVQPSAFDSVRSELGADKNGSELVSSTSQLLSRLTAQAGLVTVPRRNRRVLRQIEFLVLSEQRILVILVMDQREVQNRVIYVDQPVDEIELRAAANYINQHFAGLDLQAVRKSLLRAMEEDRESIDAHMKSTLELASQAVGDEEDEGDYVFTGGPNLFQAAADGPVDRLKELFEAFEKKRDVLNLVDRCLQAEGVQLFIGEEAGLEVFGDVSMVFSPYKVSGQSLGVLGVIGPTRMDYERVIPMVDVTAKLLSFALEEN